MLILAKVMEHYGRRWQMKVVGKNQERTLMIIERSITKLRVRTMMSVFALLAFPMVFVLLTCFTHARETQCEPHVICDYSTLYSLRLLMQDTVACGIVAAMGFISVVTLLTPEVERPLAKLVCRASVLAATVFLIWIASARMA